MQFKGDPIGGLTTFIYKSLGPIYSQPWERANMFFKHYYPSLKQSGQISTFVSLNYSIPNPKQRNLLLLEI